MNREEIRYHAGDPRNRARVRVNVLNVKVNQRLQNDLGHHWRLKSKACLTNQGDGRARALRREDRPPWRRWNGELGREVAGAMLQRRGRAGAQRRLAGEGEAERGGAWDGGAGARLGARRRRRDSAAARARVRRAEVAGRLSNPPNRDRKGNGKGVLKTREIH